MAAVAPYRLESSYARDLEGFSVPWRPQAAPAPKSLFFNADLAEEHRAAVAELRREAAKLMPGVGLRDRLGALGHGVAGEEGGAGLARQGASVEAELFGELRVEEQRLRRRRGFGTPRDRKARQVAGVGVVETEGGSGHGADP